MTRPDFTTPPHKPQFSGWLDFMRKSDAALSRLRRIWAVEPRAVSRRCWHWLTA